MDIDAAIKCADTALTTHLGRHLRAPEVTILQGAWARMTYEEIAETSKYSLNYLKRDVGPKFWKALSQVFGEEVNKSNVQGVLARQGMTLLAELTPQVPSDNQMLTVEPIVDWQYAPALSPLVGRQAEMSLLKRWIQEEHSALVLIQGMAGVGKTILARRIAEDVKSKYKYVFWRSLDPATTLQQLVTDLLQVSAIAKSAEQAPIDILVKLLQSSTCLLILDGVENIFASGQLAGQYDQQYQDYADFFLQISKVQHRSCVLMTTQEQPCSLASLMGPDAPVQIMRLEGFPEADAQTFLAAEGLNSQADCSQLIDLYQGNPVALGIVANWIRTVFSGNVTQFLDCQTVLLREIDELLTPCFRRLTPEEQNFLYVLMLAEEALGISDLIQCQELQITQADLLDVLASLNARSLICSPPGTHRLTFTLPSLVKAYVLSQLQAEVGGLHPEDPGHSNLSLQTLSATEELTLSPVQAHPTRLNQWFQGQIDPQWQPLEILWRNQSELMPRLRNLAHLRDGRAIKRVQRLQLRTSHAVYEIDLLVMVAPKANQRLRIQIQVQSPVADEYLPANLSLALLNDAGESLSEVQSRTHDDGLRLPAFSGELSEGFKIRLGLDNQEMIEEFVL